MPIAKRYFAHAALFAVALIYGSNYTIAKEVLNNFYLTPSAFITIRVIAGTILFWFVTLFLPKEPIEKKDWGLLILCAFFGIAANQLLFFWGLKNTTPIHGSLIMTMVPILVLILGSFYLGERITRLKVLGILIGMSGAILLITQGQELGNSGDTMLGDLLILANATSFGIYLTISKPLVKKYNPFILLRWLFLIGFFFVIPFGCQDLAKAEWHTFPSHIWWAIGFVLLCTTFLAYLLNAYALKLVRATVVSIYIYLQPLIATAIALAVGQDQLDGTKILAGLLIFTGVAMVSFRKMK